MNAQLGQILDKWYKETKKTQIPLLKKPGEKVADHWACPSTQHLLKVGEPPKPPSQTTEHTPTFTPFKDKAQPPPGASKQENGLFVLTPACCSRGPIKAWPEFLVWPLMNFYRLRKPRTLVSNKCPHLPLYGRDLGPPEKPSFEMVGLGPWICPMWQPPLLTWSHFYSA